MIQQYSDQELIEELKRRTVASPSVSTMLADATEQLRLINIRLQESEKTKSQFLSNVRNQMNNPLAAILGLSADIVRLGPDQYEQISRMAVLVYEEAFDLDFQLKNIVAAAELESGEMRIGAVQTDIGSLVESLMALYTHRIKQKNLRLVFRNELPLTGDTHFHFPTAPAQLHLILSNLIANAIEYSSENGVISLTCRLEHDCLQFSVEDGGLGIAQTNQNVIFDRFFQLDQGTTRCHRGHGLGLSVAKALLDLLGGNIEVISREQGSVFSFFLPEIPTDNTGADLAIDGNALLFQP
jgi:signal transduction histidine kinase